MCGRYVVAADGEALARAFGLRRPLPWRPRYNVAPSQEVPAVRAGPEGREGVLLRWGLVPPWAEDLRFGYRTINARAETVDRRPAFRAAFRRRRCLLPATGFYEWQRLNRHKQPYLVRLRDRELFAFAGLWERWVGPEGETVESCAIIVTDAPPPLARVHDRMPVILDPEAHEAWLDPEAADLQALKALLRPYPPQRLAWWPVSTRVNNPRQDDPSLLEPVAPP